MFCSVTKIYISSIPVKYQWANFDISKLFEISLSLALYYHYFIMGDNGVILTLILHEGFNFVSTTNIILMLQ